MICMTSIDHVAWWEPYDLYDLRDLAYLYHDLPDVCLYYIDDVMTPSCCLLCLSFVAHGSLRSCPETYRRRPPPRRGKLTEFLGHHPLGSLGWTRL